MAALMTIKESNLLAWTMRIRPSPSGVTWEKLPRGMAKESEEVHANWVASEETPKFDRGEKVGRKDRMRVFQICSSPPPKELPEFLLQAWPLLRILGFE